MNDDEYGYEDEDFEESPEQDNPLRNLRNRGKSLAKELREERERNAQLEAELRAGRLEKALKNSNVENYEKVARLVPSDIAPDQVGEWLEEYGDVLGVKNTAAPEPQTPAEQDPEVQAMQAMQTMSATGSVPSGQVSEADLNSAPSYEAFLEILRRAGNDKFGR